MTSKPERTFSSSTTLPKIGVSAIRESVDEGLNDSFYELEDELEMEEALAKLTAKLERLKEQNMLRIGAKQFELNEKDPIFFLNGPNRKETRTGACMTCRDFIFEKNSQMHFC